MKTRTIQCIVLLIGTISGKACYKYANLTRLNFADANAYCERVSARLADVNPNDAINDVIGLIRRNGYHEMDYWINLNNTFQEVRDRSATILASRCAAIGPYPSYVIRSVTCDSRYLFVCQHDPLTSTSVQRRQDNAISCLGKYGYFPHPTDCRRYLLCFNGHKSNFRCARGQVFSMSVRRCRAATHCEDNSPQSGKDDQNESADEDDNEEEASSARRNEEHPMVCESGSRKHRRKCFRVYENRLSWENASSFCEEKKSRLVTITNLKEMKFLRKLIKRKNNRLDYWIGLNDKVQESVFVWSDGNTFQANDYHLWAKRSRRRFNTYRDCVKLDKRAKYRWMDATCTEKNYFICEKDAVRGWKQPNPDCGLFRVIGQPRVGAIVGGTHAIGTEHPWQVSLRLRGDHKCGGSLIDNCWVMTAAHCVSLPDVAPAEIPTEAVLGDFNLLSRESGEERLEIEDVFVHPKWEAYPVPKNDIAILKLRNCSRKHNPICFPTSKTFSFPSGTKCNVAGYGTVNPNRQVYPNVLMEATVPLIPTKTCRALYKNRRNLRKSYVTSAMFCAGYKKGGIDACQGDSGGPLTCNNAQIHRETQWGIVSWGNGCAEANKPGVYTKVVHFFDWIRNVTMINF